MRMLRALPPRTKDRLKSLAFSAIRLKDVEAYRISTWRYGAQPRVHLADAFPGIESADVMLLRAFDRTEDTSMDANEVLVLCAIERFVGAASVLEIGTFDGNTTLNLAANAEPGGKVTTVDLPPDWDGTFHYDVPTDHRNVTSRDEIGGQYRGTPYEAMIQQVYGDSAALDWSGIGGDFDLIFIDGNHYFDYVKKDTENALEHLAPRGVVVWHDYGLIEDVSLVVDETATRLPVHAISGTRLAVARG